ncbi:hypothetical protein LINPERPRIM_LOCUS25649 [Linum perenne]
MSSVVVNAEGNTAAIVLKRKSSNIGWQYGTLLDPNNLGKIKCNFCKHINSGGIFRFKQHIAGNDSNVSKCRKVPKEARDACLKAFAETAERRRKRLLGN